MEFNIDKNVKIESKRKSFADYCKKYVNLENVSELVKEEILEDIKIAIDENQDLSKLYKLSNLPSYKVPEEKVDEISKEVSNRLKDTKYNEDLRLEEIIKAVTHKRLQELKIKTIEKIVHIQRVSIMSQKIAASQNLSDEDVKLAGEIGLLHDIGRFEQLRVYNHFNDAKSMDHGKYSVEVLFKKDENGRMLIENFSEEKNYDTIKKALELHNKDLSILNETELSTHDRLHCKLIRDADKVDIYRVVTEGDNLREMSGKELQRTPYITDSIYDKFVNDNMMAYREMSTGMDQLVAKFGFTFDINFEKSGELILEGGYLDKVYNLGIEYIKDEETMKRFTEMYEISKNNLVKSKDIKIEEEKSNNQLQNIESNKSIFKIIFNKLKSLFNKQHKVKEDKEKYKEEKKPEKDFNSKYRVNNHELIKPKNESGEEPIQNKNVEEKIEDDMLK